MRSGRLIAVILLAASVLPAVDPGFARAPSTPPASAPTVAAAGSQVSVAVDHHLHVHSPAILAFLPGYCSSPGRIGKCPEAFTRAYGMAELIAQMDNAGIRRGLIMSTAYLAESPMMVPENPDHANILHAANAWTVAEARKYSGRFGVYIGVNPMTDTALSEIAYWGADPNVTGVKIHLTNSGVDLRDPAQAHKLAKVLRAAARSHLAITIHMRTRAPDYGARDVESFVRVVLPAAGNTPVQIAHAAGWGGTDPQTLSALAAFAEALETQPLLAEHLTFDLAEVWGADTSDANLVAMATVMRRIGLSHFVPASDYPFSGDLARYYGALYPRLPLTPAEWAVIQSNQPAYAQADYYKQRLLVR